MGNFQTRALWLVLAILSALLGPAPAAAQSGLAPSAEVEAALRAVLSAGPPFAIKQLSGLLAQLPDRPSAWMLRGEVLSALGKGLAARRAYTRAVQLGPDRRPAIRALLWLLIGQVAAGGKDAAAARNQLPASLVRFHRAAQRGTTLWRACAAGYLLLGNAPAALPFFTLGWRRKSADLLWLADWADALQRAHRPTAARRLSRQAIRLLRPAALRAAHPAASPYEREVLRTFVLLLRHQRTPGVGIQWLRQVLAHDLDSDAVDELKTLWQQENPSAAESPVAVASTAFSKSMPVRLRGAVGETGGKLAAGSAKKEASADDADTEEEAEAEADDDAEDQDSEDDDAADSAPAGVALAQPADSAAEVEDEAEEPEPTRRFAASLSTEVRSLGGLQLLGAQGRSELSIGRLGLGLRTGYTFLTKPAEWADAQLGGLRWGEVDLSAVAKWRLPKGKIELGGGGNLRAAQSLAYGWLHGDYEVGRGLVLELNAGLNQVVEDTAELRLLGARDRIAPAVYFDLTQREFINGFAGWQRYQSRQRQLLSDGYFAYLEAGHRLLLFNPGWSVRLTGYWEQNRLVPRLPKALQSLLGNTDLEVADFVIPQFAMVGAGTTLRRGVPGVAPTGDRRLQLFADLWLGYVWPHNSFGFDLQLGLGLPLPRAGEVSVSGFVSNSRHPGGTDAVSWGAGLRYAY